VKVGILRESAMKELVWDFVANRRGGAPIKQISSCSKCLGPEGRRHGSMDEKGADGVVDGAKHTLCFAILLGSVGIRMAKQNATTGQEGRHGVIDEFSAIVGLKALGNRVKLSLNMDNKVNKVTIDVRFLA
jgi:hypothetical protein